MLVRRTAMDDIGMWDDHYFLHCEDLDWCMRFRQKGWNILFEPRAQVLHIHGACSQSRPVFVEWHKHKGMVRFYRKFFQHQYPGVLMWLVIAGIWIRFALLAAIKSFKKQSAEADLTQKIKIQQARQLQASLLQDANLKSSVVKKVAVVGASSMVGRILLPQLIQSGWHVVAYSRKHRENSHPGLSIEWREMPLLGEADQHDAITDWIWLAPIRILPEHLEFMRNSGAKNVVAVSTTSRFTKIDSSSDYERKFVEELIYAEDKLQIWAEENNATWTILRPTLIFGLGLDKNVNVIAKFISRFHFFPILGLANGLRQPIHVSDVASACKAALDSNNAKNRAYNISGAEIVSYREMVKRIFGTLGIRPRFLSIPLWLFAAGMATVRLLPPFRTWSSAMAERMNHNMEFDHDAASRDFDFKPRGFVLNRDDLS
jgi:nucleoside-diphosphate-sugar epimerase